MNFKNQKNNDAFFIMIDLSLSKIFDWAKNSTILILEGFFRAPKFD